jgi:hypothetical protein
MKPKKHLSFGSLRHFMSNHIKEYPDWRQGNKSAYSIHDGVMSGFACMYFQSPSLLRFQRELEDKRKNNNMKALFGVSNIPENTQLRHIIDKVDSEYFRDVFKEFLVRLQRGKQLERYQFLDGKYLCDIDGTQFFSSKKVTCPQCLTARHANDEITCSHKALQGAIVHPDMKQVIPLAPEQIVNSDGTSKQDCEINASKRWLLKVKKDHPRLNLIINADGLSSKQPFITEVSKVGYNYIIVAKPTDHTYMMEWISVYDEIPGKRVVDAKGRIHEYEWVSDIPLSGRADAIHVNFFRYRILSIDKNGKEKTNFRGSWVTDLPVNKETIEIMVKGARSRWKIENECFNTLKNQGYCLEHNYGHGEENLCFNMYLFILLSFYFHQIFELTDHLYQACRVKFGSKLHMWEKLRSAITWFVFESWESMLSFALNPERYDPTIKAPG